MLAAMLAQLFLPQPGLPVASAATFNIANGDVAALKTALVASGAPHTINLAPNGTYTLTTVDNNTPLGPTGLPVIDRNITINGNGAKIVRSSAGQTPLFRIFLITSTGTLTLNNLVISNGSDNTAYGGGGVFNSGGSLNVNFSTFSNNLSDAGGGAIANVGQGLNSGSGALIPVTATLNVNYSTFSTNQLTSGFGGGAIYNAAAGGSGTSQSGGTGAAIASVVGSTFVTNTSATSGGGIFNGASNGSGQQGGLGTALLSVTNSTFAANVAANAGGGILNLNLNTAAGSASAVLTLTNTTFSANQSTASFGGGVAAGSLAGFGIVKTTLLNTLVASNTGGNCFNSLAPFSPGTQNLEYTGSAGSPACGTGSTVTVSNPLAAAGLADNGGPTKTIDLAVGSPALDGGDDSICSSAPVNSVDQRGFIRPSGPKCDIGAVEAGSSLVVRNITDTGDGLTTGSLSFAFKLATAGQQINFALTTGNSITVSGNLPPLPKGVKLVNVCTNPKIIIDGTGVTGDGLVLQGNNTLTGLQIQKFAGRQIVTAGPGNHINCTLAIR